MSVFVCMHFHCGWLFVTIIISLYIAFTSPFYSFFYYMYMYIPFCLVCHCAIHIFPCTCTHVHVHNLHIGDTFQYATTCVHLHCTTKCKHMLKQIFTCSVTNVHAQCCMCMFTHDIVCEYSIWMLRTKRLESALYTHDYFLRHTAYDIKHIPILYHQRL